MFVIISYRLCDYCFASDSCHDQMMNYTVADRRSDSSSRSDVPMWFRPLWLMVLNEQFAERRVAVWDLEAIYNGL